MKCKTPLTQEAAGMARGKKPKEPPRGTPAWMVTYGDMMTLVLTFFVLLFAISSVDMQKYKKAVNSLRGALGGNVGVLEQGTALEPTGGVTGADNQVLEQLQKILGKSDTKDKVEIRKNGKDIIVSFKEKLFFTIGSADILNEAIPLLTEVGTIIRDQQLAIRVEGHTCDIPIRNSKFPSNWELSAIRAVNVSKYLIEKVRLRPEKVSVAGYGQYRPMVANTSDEARARNRRVDLVILNAITNGDHNQQDSNNNSNSKGEDNGGR
jgi:chemotaxis protein MotB